MSLAHIKDIFMFSLGLLENEFLFHEKYNAEESSSIGSYHIFDTPILFNFGQHG